MATVLVIQAELNLALAAINLDQGMDTILETC